MAVITMKQLLETGVHFGHQTKRWNPKMKKYIFGERNGIHIINLEQTVELIEKDAYPFVVETVKQGKSVLFVGTKKQAQDALKEEAERCGQYYINTTSILDGLAARSLTSRPLDQELTDLTSSTIWKRWVNLTFFPKKKLASSKLKWKNLKPTLAVSVK